jgi:hypothetical protein
LLLAASDFTEERVYKNGDVISSVWAHLPMHEIIRLFRALIAMDGLYGDCVVLERHLDLVLVRILEASAFNLEMIVCFFPRDEMAHSYGGSDKHKTRGPSRANKQGTLHQSSFFSCQVKIKAAKKAPHACAQKFNHSSPMRQFLAGERAREIRTKG